MRKTIFITILCLLLTAIIPMSAFAQYATGDAAGVSVGGGTLSGVSFTGKLESMPLIWGAGLGFDGQNLGIAVTADRWMIHNYIGTIELADVYFYLGPGADVEMVLGNVFALDIGARMPIGFSWLVDSPGWEPWEIFTEVYVGVNLIGFITSDAYSALTLLGLPIGQEIPFNVFNTVDLGLSLGFRYWF